MKTRILLALAVLTAVSLCMLAACKRDGNAAAMSGRYVIVEITDDPDGVNYAELDGMYKEMDLDLKDYMYMEFSDDGAFKLVLFGDEEAKGTYTRDGNIVTINANGETVNTILDGKKITWIYENGTKLIFEKK